MTYRKGVDLLVGLIPKVIEQAKKEHLNIRFIIAGDGPKLPLLIEMIKRGGYENIITLMGSVPHHKVRDVMVKG